MSERLALVDLPVGGSSVVGQLGDVAIGAYTDIDIIAPSEAAYGDLVDVEVWVQNLHTDYIYISVSGRYHGVDISFSPDYANVGPRQTYPFTASFIMPNNNVRLEVWSFYWTGTEWYQDDYDYVDIALSVVWQKLAERQVTITPEVVEWQKLATKTVTITPEVVEWQKLAERQVTITPEVVEVVWQKLATKTITITPEIEIPPEYQLIQDTIYPWSYTFQGDAEVCTFEFKLTPEQVPGTRWLSEKIVDSFASKLEEEGSRLLGLKVYEDTTPTFWTNYRVEVTATASPIAWMPIIIGVLAILFIVAIIFAIRAIDEVFFKRKALDEETKKTFSRETLTAMILDLSPETPPETLEAMEDQELRDLLNRLLAEAAPPISPWGILALVGCLGVVGVGAAVAFAKAKPAE